ncbi:protein turtle homolog B [Alosa sapidissima]|uniref:protein turtle homolog B n=1 Tax=Alosa sapidissima TaxID=34773 RepID=UPI001C08D98A|nr:protein turtle homolog B [Alosa sapidissima]
MTLIAVATEAEESPPPHFLTARAGESVVLPCHVTQPRIVIGQQTSYVVEWFKAGNSIPIFISFRYYPPHVDPDYAGRATLQGKSSLRIDRVAAEDHGWYECKILVLEQQYDGFQNGSWVHLTVNAPPSFRQTPPQYVETQEGISVTLTCVANGNPTPTVSWLREGKVIHGNGKYKVTDGSLTFTAVTREDRGGYSCRAYSLQGEAIHTTRLLVQGPPFIISPPENVTLNVSQDALFTCQSEAYPGNLTYTWSLGEENVFFKNGLKRRVSILIDGSLIVSRVIPEDAGKYTCRPSNGLGTAPSASAYLSVQYPARVVNMPSVIYGALGYHGYLRCPADANPPVNKVSWRRDGLPLRVEKHPGWTQMADGNILIAEVTEDMLGTYTCTPYNVLGSTGQSRAATLVLKDPPKFLAVPAGEYRQEVGREVVVPCEADTNITWRKVGLPSHHQHVVLPHGSLHILSLAKEDHGIWECVATNEATSITASTKLLVSGTTPHAPLDIHVAVTASAANVSWEPGYNGGFEQTFTVWIKRESLGAHDWLSLPVTVKGQHWLLLKGLQPETIYEFSILSSNKMGTGRFSEVVTASTLDYPLTTHEPPLVLTPPRCLTANRTQQGVVLMWIPPANHSLPIDRYVVEFRLAERWEVFDDSILPGDTELLARDLQEAWYEFRVMAVMEDIVSEPSNIVGVSSTDAFPPPELADESLARPVVAGVVATVCFLASGIIFSIMAMCVVSQRRERRRKARRRRGTVMNPGDPPLSITHCKKSVGTPTSSEKVSPESSRSAGPQSGSSEERLPEKKQQPLPPPSPRKEREKEDISLSLYKSAKRAIISKRSRMGRTPDEPPAQGPIELISRGPDGRFNTEPPANIRESSGSHRDQRHRIRGFPFVEESDMYPEFRQSDEEEEESEAGTIAQPPMGAGRVSYVPSTMRTMLRPPQVSPLSSSQESYLHPPAYSPRLQRPLQGYTILETSRLRPPGPLHDPPTFPGGFAFPSGHYYDYSLDPDPPPPFYLAEMSPLRSSVMSSPPYHLEGSFGCHPPILEELGEELGEEGAELQPFYSSSGVEFSSASRSSDMWHPGEPLPFAGLEGPHLMFPLYHQLQFQREPALPPPAPLLLPPPLPAPSSYPAVLPLHVPRGRHKKSPSKARAQEVQQVGALRHTAQGLGVPVLPFLPEPEPPLGPFGGLDMQWYEVTSQLSPPQPRRLDPGWCVHPMVLQPSRLSPLTQSPLSSLQGSPIRPRPRPRPGHTPPSLQSEASEITLLPPSTASFSRKSSPSPSASASASPGRRSQRGSPRHRALTGPEKSPPSPRDARSEATGQRRVGDPPGWVLDASRTRRRAEELYIRGLQPEAPLWSV